MKIALVHDHLCGIGGSERVFQYLCEAFPEADLFTLAHREEKTFPYFSTRALNKTWLDPFVFSANAFRWLFVPATWAMKSFDFSSYDLVISSSATTAKYIDASRALHICYCYIPTRALWHFDSYFGSGLKTKLLKGLLPWLKKRDFAAAQKVDCFFTISEMSKGYIQEYYNRDSAVVHCPIDASKFRISSQKENHYLIVSRLEHWKKVDYAIEAFNKMGLPLKIIGKGAEEERLRALAKSNISFLGEASDSLLAEEYSRCKAVIFTPFLEYGLIPLEANASGTPVIAYGKGGIRETMIEGKTAVFFEEQTPESLAQAVQQFETMSFDPVLLRAHALQWDIPSFKKTFREMALSKLQGVS